MGRENGQRKWRRWGLHPWLWARVGRKCIESFRDSKGGHDWRDRDMKATISVAPLGSRLASETPPVIIEIAC
jgi:hypothetical protein